MIVKTYAHAEGDLSSVKIRNVCASLTSGSSLAHCVPAHKNGIFAPLPSSSQWHLLEFSAAV